METLVNPAPGFKLLQLMSDDRGGDTCRVAEIIENTSSEHSATADIVKTIWVSFYLLKSEIVGIPKNVLLYYMKTAIEIVCDWHYQ